MEAEPRVQLFTCVKCDYQSRHFDYILTHYSTRHAHEAGFSVVCGIDCCQSRFKSMNSYKRHIRSKHPVFHHANTATKNRCAVVAEDNQGDVQAPDLPGIPEGDNDGLIGNDTENVEQDGNNDNMDNARGAVNDLDMYRYVAQKLLHIREFKKLPYNSISHVLEIMESVCSFRDSHIQAKLNEILEGEVIPDQEKQAITALFSNESLDFQNLAQHFSSETHLNSYVEDHFDFVGPIEYAVGEGMNAGSFQYISIIETLKMMLKNEEVFAQVMNPHTSVGMKLSDVCDGCHFKRNQLFSEHPNALQIMLYFDEFTVVNPIGYKATKYKFAAFYFLLGNIEPKYRSKLHVIQLIALADAKLVKEHGFGIILKYLMKDLHVLETEGIQISRPEGDLQLKGSLTVVIGDNLGSHAIGGYMESFNVRRPCRFCNIERTELQTLTDLSNIPRRTVESYNDQVQIVEANPDMSSLYGVKKNSVLNELTFFHVVGGLPSDIAHDLFESGLVCDVLHAVIEYCVNAGHFSLNYLNGRIREWKYASTDKVNKPNTVAPQLHKLKVKQNCVQVWCLLRLFPLLVGEAVPEGDPKWEVLISLVKMVENIAAPVTSPGDVAYLKDITITFHNLYRREFPNKLLKPKGHYTLHYPEQILDFGPLYHCWSMRFEGKHSFFKEVVRRTKNKKNLCLTMAYRHQYFQSVWHESSSFLSGTAYVPYNGNVIPTNFLLPAVQELLQPLIGNEKSVFQCQSVQINGTLYSSGCCVVTSIVNDNLQFGKFENGFIIGGFPYILCENLETVEYQCHYNCYEVKETARYSLYTQESLLDFHPLGIYFKKGELCIVLHHYIPVL